MIIGRRLAIQGLLTATGLGFSTHLAAAVPAPSGTPSAASPRSPVQPVFDVPEVIEHVTYDREWATARVVRFPRVIGVRDVDQPLECVLTWDERLFSFSEEIFALTDQVVPVQTRTLGAGRVLMTVPAGASQVFFDASNVPLYPAENLDSVVITEIRNVEPGAAAEPPYLSLAADEAPVHPWGVELSVDWTTTGNVVSPAALFLASVGPNPAPVGLTIQVRCPAEMDVSNIAAPQNVLWSMEEQGDRRTVYLRLTEPLLAGTSADVDFGQERAITEPTKTPTVIAGAWVEQLEDTHSSRRSGKLAAFPLTESGVLASSFKEESTPA